jgi:imidazolonepropionase-like amidohydrolase
MEGIRETLGTDSSGGRLLTAGLNNVRDVIGIAASHGVQVLGGTDLHLSHGTVSLEAERLEAYGLSAESALAGITDNGYRYFGSDRTFGSGQSADVVVCRADPRHDLTTLRDPSFVMRAGHIIARS